MAWTSSPRRYQSRRLLTAKLCLLCGIPHNRHYADGGVMRPAVAFPLAGVVELVL